jgi:putative methanogenesis marker protein 3
MIEIHLDGTRMETSEGATLGDILPDLHPECCVAVIRPTGTESAETRNIRFITTAGEIVVEIADSAMPLLKEGVFDAFFSSEEGSDFFNLGWSDRYVTAFGPFRSAIVPSRAPHRYRSGDVILGCGGYDPARSYLIFSKAEHHADHGTAADGGVVGRVVSGRSVLDRLSTGDVIRHVERVISWEDQTISFTSTDRSLVLEDGMWIVSNVIVTAEGYGGDEINTAVVGSVEHLLLALNDGYFWVGRSASTHIRDEKLKGTNVPQELKRSRLEGTVTVRTAGKSRGCVYIYTQDTPGSPDHTVVGSVVHGIELIRLARKGDRFRIRVDPERFDLIGLSISEAQELANRRAITFQADTEGDERVVVAQEPATTLEVVAAREVRVATRPVTEVIDIRLHDREAPATCAIFRDVTGLKWHKVGTMPFFYRFEDVYLFRPGIKSGTTINLENIPGGTVEANTLAMTNDARKSAGLVGVRTTPNSEFGPTSEPLAATNVIGELLEPEKLENAKEGDLVYIREVPP